jgi:hypothetical protein
LHRLPVSGGGNLSFQRHDRSLRVRDASIGVGNLRLPRGVLTVAHSDLRVAPLAGRCLSCYEPSVPMPVASAVVLMHFADATAADEARAVIGSTVLDAVLAPNLAGDLDRDVGYVVFAYP